MSSAALLSLLFPLQTSLGHQAPTARASQSLHTPQQLQLHHHHQVRLILLPPSHTPTLPSFLPSVVSTEIKPRPLTVRAVISTGV